MAAPTGVLVESNSLTTTTLHWTGGANAIGVYRSTDGAAYTLIGGVAQGVLTFTDTDLAVGTKYWYKLSDDDGATFSSVVTVHTQACLPPAGSGDTFSLPRLGGPEDLVVDPFNNLAERIENVLAGRVLAPEACVTCPVDGAIVLDCSGHCKEWIVIADADINSISMQYCNEGAGSVKFLIPPNVTRRITGWPNGLGFSGNEPSVVSGANGRTIGVDFFGVSGGGGSGGAAGSSSSSPGTGGGIGSGGGRSSGTGAGAGCSCTPRNGLLTIKSCNANNSLNCGSTKSLKLIACGGREPYSWSRTGTVDLKGATGPAGSTASGTTITVTPPTNSGSAVAGTAYNTLWWMCSACVAGACTTVNNNQGRSAGCNDQDLLGCVTAGSLLGCTPATPSAGSVTCCQAGVGCTCLPETCVATCTGTTTVCDARTAPMIAAGCNPCGLNAEGATVSVTDALGVVTTIVLTN